MESKSLDSTSLKRMEWRCRRGMLELDLLFTDFVKQYLPNLSDLQIQALDELLDLPDQQLWNLVSDSSSLKSRHQEQIIVWLRGGPAILSGDASLR
jgi:antitoxin CptB